MMLLYHNFNLLSIFVLCYLYLYMYICCQNNFTYFAGINNCEGIAIDWMGNNIYWTDEAFKTINVARLDDPDTWRVVVNNSMSHPRAIVVDPRNGYVHHPITTACHTPGQSLLTQGMGTYITP